MNDRDRKHERFDHLPRHASDADVQRALSDLRQLWAPTPRQRVELRVARAKDELNEACAAALKNEPGAAERADGAYEELAAARAQLAMLDAQESA